MDFIHVNGILKRDVSDGSFKPRVKRVTVHIPPPEVDLTMGPADLTRSVSTGDDEDLQAAIALSLERSNESQTGTTNEDKYGLPGAAAPGEVGALVRSLKMRVFVLKRN